jgi:hypothetical protein
MTSEKKTRTYAKDRRTRNKEYEGKEEVEIEMTPETLSIKKSECEKSVNSNIQI